MSYADRLTAFNSMLEDTNKNIENARQVSKSIDPRDPVGSGLKIAGISAGGVSGIAQSVAGIQHFQKYQSLAKSAITRLGKPSADGPTGSGSAGTSSGASAAEGAAPAPNLPAAGQAVNKANPSLEEDLASRSDIAPPAGASPSEAVNIMSENVSNKADLLLNPASKQALNSQFKAVADRPRPDLAENGSDEQITAAGQQVRLQDNMVNDLAERQALGKPPPSGGYTNTGAPIEDAPQSAGGALRAAQTNTNVSDGADAGEDLSTTLARGNAALQGQGEGGSAANMAARLQQGGADASQNASTGLSSSRALLPGVENPGATETVADTASNGLASVGTKAAEKVATKAGESALEETGEISATSAATGDFPLAGAVAIIGGLVSLGTTIADALHKKPKATPTVVQQPTQVMAVGANLAQNKS